MLALLLICTPFSVPGHLRTIPVSIDTRSVPRSMTIPRSIDSYRKAKCSRFRSQKQKTWKSSGRDMTSPLRKRWNCLGCCPAMTYPRAPKPQPRGPAIGRQAAQSTHTSLQVQSQHLNLRRRISACATAISCSASDDVPSLLHLHRLAFPGSICNSPKRFQSTQRHLHIQALESGSASALR